MNTYFRQFTRHRLHNEPANDDILGHEGMMGNDKVKKKNTI